MQLKGKKVTFSNNWENITNIIGKGQKSIRNYNGQSFFSKWMTTLNTEIQENSQKPKQEEQKGNRVKACEDKISENGWKREYCQSSKKEKETLHILKQKLKHRLFVRKIQTRIQWNTTFNVLKERRRGDQMKTLYPRKTYFRTEGKIINCLDKGKLIECIMPNLHYKKCQTSFCS